MVSSVTAGDMRTGATTPGTADADRITRIARLIPMYPSIEPERWAHVPDSQLDALERVAAQPVTEHSSTDENAVQAELDKLRTAAEARRRLAAENAPQAQRELPEIVPLDEFLAQPDEDAPQLIEGVMPIGNTLLVAQAKTGKTMKRPGNPGGS